MISGMALGTIGCLSGVKMKVRFFSPVCNNPDFIKLQAKTLKKFIQDDYEYIVLNDGLTAELVKEISDVCNDIGVECIEVPKTLIHSSAAVAHCSVMQWAYDNIVLDHCSNDICAFIDADMFVVKSFSVNEFVGKNAIAGLPQYRGPIEYFWPGLLFLNIPKMPNPENLSLFCGIVRGYNVDAGGTAWHYLYENRGIPLRGMEHTSHIHPCNSNMDVLPKGVAEKYDQEFRIEILESSFLHYGGASTKNFPDQQKRKRDFIEWLLEECCNDNIAMPKIEYVYKETSS